MDSQEYIASIYDFIKANEVKIECDYYDEEGHVLVRLPWYNASAFIGLLKSWTTGSLLDDGIGCEVSENGELRFCLQDIIDYLYTDENKLDEWYDKFRELVYGPKRVKGVEHEKNNVR